ncbi:MAG: hypothetical protein GVY17_01725 [Cyanobacteria bacterium]|jgi:hypothetical protein|nr:hypothetical protein [Cyanobacteria bacterium GSL.Bin21]
MRRDPENDQIILNPILGQQPSIGPIPATQLLPWSLIVVLAYIATNFFFDFGLLAWLLVSFWGMGSWWLLTGENPAHFLNLWRFPPGKEWIFCEQKWGSPLRKPKDFLVSLKRINPVRIANKKGGMDNFMPFHNSLDLVCFGRTEIENMEVSFYILKGNGQWRCVFPFALEGIHTRLTSQQVGIMAQQIEEGIKEFPNDEKATFILGSSTETRSREWELEVQSRNATIPLCKALNLDQAVKTRNLGEQGIRQNWDQLVFCTYTVSEAGESKADDPLGKLLNLAKKRFDQWMERIKGAERRNLEEFFRNLIFHAYHDGFTHWSLLLNTKMGVNVRPLTEKELWRWTFRRFNSFSVPLPEKVPQVLVLRETDLDVELSEEINYSEHTITVLTEGTSFKSSIPEHRGTSDTLWVRGKACGLLTMDRKPKGWSSTREQMTWLWTVMSNVYVHDTEAVVEIGKANQNLVEDQLTRQAKQSQVKRRRAQEKQGLEDVSASLQAEETLEAQRKIVRGNQVFVTAPVFIVYRQHSQALKKSMQLLANSFGTAKMKRERNVAWALWLESLPVTMSWLRTTTSPLTESRLYFDSEEVMGVLPFMKPRALDSTGVELLTSGGKPLQVDLFENQTERLLITGKSGSGKSVLASQFVIQALSSGVPVVGMDIAVGESTFKTLTGLLGDDGAYYDVLKTSSNLMEVPDLRGFSKEVREERMKLWENFTRRTLLAITMGKVDDPSLQQRCENILTRLLKVFLEDQRIIQRYKNAIEQGWKSSQWQEIPVLRDVLSFCSLGKLELEKDALTERALTQIRSQINALLDSELGNTIGKPSSFSPSPMMKFFALGGLSSDYSSYIMSLSAYSACMRTVLASRKSLFVGDELSVLFRRPGFSELVGELSAVGRKQGIGMVLLSQDPDGIANSSAGEQIVQNLGYRITGSISSSAMCSFQKYFGYRESDIVKNASEAYLPDSSQLCSYWLVEKAGIFSDCRYYPSPMLLGAVANSQMERAARNRVFTQYPDTELGQLQALKSFSDQYVAVRKQELGQQGFDQIAPNFLQDKLSNNHHKNGDVSVSYSVLLNSNLLKISSDSEN